MKAIILYILYFAIVVCFTLPLNGQIITTIAGGATGHGGYWGDGGPATASEIGLVGSIAIDDMGNIFIADGNNQRIRKVDALTGLINTIAGTGIAGYNGDGISATIAKLNNPAFICLDNSNNLYIVDEYNYRIRKVDVITGIITTCAGNGTYGNTGDGNPATAVEIYSNGAIVVDTIGNLYLGSGRSIRKVNKYGFITTIAGTGLPGVIGEGVPATATTINPECLGVDGLGNIYMSDTTNSIRKITVSTGIMTRVAGTGDNIYNPYSGDGLVAIKCHIGPFGIVVDNPGNIYISDYGNSRIEKVNMSSGIINSIAGTGSVGYSGDFGYATLAELSRPEGVTLDACGNVYIADFGNSRIRKITYPIKVPTISLSSVVAAKAGTTVTVTATVANAGSSYIIHWMNHGVEFTTTTTPSVTYTKGAGIDTITARVVSTATYGCYDSTTSAGHVVSVDKTGVTSPGLSTGGEVTVFPNPAHNEFTITSSGKISNVTISNMVGQVVYSEPTTPEPQIASYLAMTVSRINIENLPTGVYFLKVTDNEGERYVRKIIKQ